MKIVHPHAAGIDIGSKTHWVAVDQIPAIGFDTPHNANQTKHPLAPFFKRIAYRKGRNAAITATARKLAMIIWNMIAKCQPYRGRDPQVVTELRKHAQIKNIKKRLFLFSLTENEMISIFKSTSYPDT